MKCCAFSLARLSQSRRIRRHGYAAYGGSDSHLVSFVGVCATEFDADFRDIDGLVRALKSRQYRPVDFRPARAVP